jgi:chromosome partitioning protein
LRRHQGHEKPAGMSILAFANQKGGVGKTTSTVSLAATLAAAPHLKRVLLVDLDPQGHASLISGSLRDQTRRPPIYRVLVEGEPIREHLRTTGYGFDLLAGGIGNSVTEKQLGDIDDGAELLAKALSEVVDAYDVVLIDCPPNLGQLLVCAFGAADYVIVPIQYESLPIDGLELILAKIKKAQSINPKLALGAIMVTRSNERTRLAQHLRAEITEQCGALVLEQVVRQDIKIGEAAFKEIPITAHNMMAPGALDYAAVAAEMVQRGLV